MDIVNLSLFVSAVVVLSVLLGLVMRCVALTVDGAIAFFADSIGQRLR